MAAMDSPTKMIPARVKPSVSAVSLMKGRVSFS